MARQNSASSCLSRPLWCCYSHGPCATSATGRRRGSAALNTLGHKGIHDVRQGKFFEVEFDKGEDLDAISRDVLSNPVIEDYRLEMAD